jgi:hypothetical protein
MREGRARLHGPSPRASLVPDTFDLDTRSSIPSRERLLLRRARDAAKVLKRYKADREDPSDDYGKPGRSRRGQGCR